VRSRFASVVLDVDSTLSGIEGIDWLAKRRGPQVAADVKALTADAMSGSRPLSDVYRRRLELVRPTLAELRALAEAYRAAIAPGAVETIARLTNVGVRVVAVTSGLAEAVQPLAAVAGIAACDVHAMSVQFDSAGNYSGFEAKAPTVSEGKRGIVEGLRLARPSLVVGDGMTDAEIRPAVDAFAAFTGFVQRRSVVACADYVVGSFAELEQLVLGTAVEVRAGTSP
jgi:phosphoserine phosphatase